MLVTKASRWANGCAEHCARHGLATRFSLKDPEIKLAALRRAAAMSHPTGDIEQILEEIERGRYE